MRYVVCLIVLQHIAPPWVFWGGVAYVALRWTYKVAKMTGKAIKEFS